VWVRRDPGSSRAAEAEAIEDGEPPA